MKTIKMKNQFHILEKFSNLINMKFKLISKLVIEKIK